MHRMVKKRSRALSRAILTQQTRIGCSVAWHEWKSRTWMASIWKGVGWGQQCTMDQSLSMLLEKKSTNPYSLFVQHLIFCYLLVLSIICTTVCWDLLKTKQEFERADFNSYVISRQVSAKWIFQNFWGWLFAHFRREQFPSACVPMQIQGTENLPLLAAC